MAAEGFIVKEMKAVDKLADIDPIERLLKLADRRYWSPICTRDEWYSAVHRAVADAGGPRVVFERAADAVLSQNEFQTLRMHNFVASELVCVRAGTVFGNLPWDIVVSEHKNWYFTRADSRGRSHGDAISTGNMQLCIDIAIPALADKTVNYSPRHWNPIVNDEWSNQQVLKEPNESIVRVALDQWT